MDNVCFLGLSCQFSALLNANFHGWISSCSLNIRPLYSVYSARLKWLLFLKKFFNCLFEFLNKLFFGINIYSFDTNMNVCVFNTSNTYEYAPNRSSTSFCKSHSYTTFIGLVISFDAKQSHEGLYLSLKE